MGVLQRFERRLGGLVEGAFARAFKAEVQPVEVAAALAREIDNGAAIVGPGRSLVPNDFVVELSERDHARLAPYEDALGGEFASMTREHAQSQGYTFVGPVVVRLERADDLETGVFRVRSGVVRGSTPEAPIPAAEADNDAPRLFLAGQAAIAPDATPALTLVTPTAVIGRARDCALRLSDPGVSRQHAELRRDGHRAVVRDLGSTNGLLVNGRRTREAALRDGDTIRLGSTTLVFRAGRAGASSPRRADRPSEADPPGSPAGRRSGEGGRWPN